MSLKTAGSKLDSCGQLPTNTGLEKDVLNNGADPVLGLNAGGLNNNEDASVKGGKSKMLSAVEFLV